MPAGFSEFVSSRLANPDFNMSAKKTVRRVQWRLFVINLIAISIWNIWPIIIYFLLSPFLNEQQSFILFIVAIWISVIQKATKSLFFSNRHRWEIEVNHQFIMASVVSNSLRIIFAIFAARAVLFGYILSGLFFYIMIFFVIDLKSEEFFADGSTQTSFDSLVNSTITVANTLSLGLISTLSPNSSLAGEHFGVLLAVLKILIVLDEFSLIGFLKNFKERGQSFRGVNREEALRIFELHRSKMGDAIFSKQP